MYVVTVKSMVENWQNFMAFSKEEGVAGLNSRLKVQGRSRDKGYIVHICWGVKIVYCMVQPVSKIEVIF